VPDGGRSACGILQGATEGAANVKSGVHPAYHLAKVVCSCGAEYEVGSTRPSMRVDVCGRCHPAYTGGGYRVVDAGGRVERFKKRFNLG
jgi:large subunit ribosomal protein L31